MQYELLITREGEAILESVLTADEVVDILRKRPPEIVEERTMEVVEVIMPDRKGGGSGKKKKLKKGTKVCKKCGEPGHMQKTCPNGAPIAKMDGSTDTVAPATKIMSREEYDGIRKAMHNKEFQSAQYALVNRMSPREVNAAVRSKSYEDYREIRQN